jgi:hypothetical protein
MSKYFTIVNSLKTVTLPNSLIISEFLVAVHFVSSAKILEQSMGARNRVGIGLLHLPARLNGLAGRYDNSVPTRFLATIDCSKIPALVLVHYLLRGGGLL